MLNKVEEKKMNVSEMKTLGCGSVCVVCTRLNWIELYKKKSTGITDVAGKI